MSCGLCGDSKKNPRKARASIKDSGSGCWYSCYKCSTNIPFAKFLQQRDVGLYAEYQKERIAEGLWRPTRVSPPQVVEAPSQPERVGGDPLLPLKRVSELGPNHRAQELCRRRMIPNVDRLYHCPRFMAWVNYVIPDKFKPEALKHDEPRLIIPFLDRSGKMVAFQGRSYRPNSEVKYVTISVDGSPLLYGMDTVDSAKPIRALEGPIDSLFVENSVAFAGGSYSALGRFQRELVTVVYDNEPRSPHTQKKVAKAIKDGYNVCIWPSYVKEKDPNDMVMNGMSIEKLNDVIKDHSFKGLEAEMEFTRWKK